MTGQADLIIGSLSIFPTAVVGTLLNFNSKIINQETETSDLSSTSFFLSKHINLDFADMILGSEEIAFLNSCAINETSYSLTVNSSLSVGEYYLIAQADANNLFVQSLTLT